VSAAEPGEVDLGQRERTASKNDEREPQDAAVPHSSGIAERS